MLCYSCYITGFRRGELVGLHWDDIDFKNHKISIKRSAYYLSGQPTSEKSPKTDLSTRTIAVYLVFALICLNNGDVSKVR